MAAARRQGGGSRGGTLLVLVGALGVLAVTFGAGVWTGRHWPVIVGQGKATVAGDPAGRRGAPERPRAAETLPELTFYQELKAPLTAPPPPPPKAGKAPRPPELELKPEPEKTDAAAPPLVPAAPLRAEPPATPELAARFTVQVAAYNARPPAEALRDTLAAAGHEARVVEADTPAGVRYRVQVGVYPTRETAREAAARLGVERALPTFVTTR